MLFAVREVPEGLREPVADHGDDTLYGLTSGWPREGGAAATGVVRYHAGEALVIGACHESRLSVPRVSVDYDPFAVDPRVLDEVIEGAKVVLTDVTGHDGRRVEAEIHESNGEAVFVRADVRVEEDWEMVVATIGVPDLR